MDERVEGILREVRQVDESHLFGRPFMTAYQLAIKLQQRHREAADALHRDVGGRGPALIPAWPRPWRGSCHVESGTWGGSYPVEGAFLSNDGITALSYGNPEGGQVESSLTAAQGPVAVSVA
jgi:hypothetical protein